MTKRLLTKDEEEPFVTLATDPLIKPLLEEWGKVTLDQLPVELIVRIVYDHLDIILAVFWLNSRLNAIQKMKGFWSSLYKTGYPEDALIIAAFLRESPDLTRLKPATITDILLLTMPFANYTGARNFRYLHNENASIPLDEIEGKLFFSGDITSLDVLYVTEVEYDGSVKTLATGRYPFNVDDMNNIDFTVRKYLIKLYLLLEETQIPDYLDTTLAFAHAIDQTDEFWGDRITFNRLYNLIIDWKEEFEAYSVKLSRFKRYASRLSDLAKELDKDPDTKTNDKVGTGSNAVTLSSNRQYFLELDDAFKEYFGLSDEAAQLVWKKLYIRKREGNQKPVPLPCTICASSSLLFRDKKLGIHFCGQICQASFYTRFAL